MNVTEVDNNNNINYIDKKDFRIVIFKLFIVLLIINVVYFLINLYCFNTLQPLLL